MSLIEIKTVGTGIKMAKDLFRVMFLTWLMMFTSVFADIYTNYYDVMYGCDVTYGFVIDTINSIYSITQCCVLCDRGQCLSVKYDRVNSKCHLNSYRHPMVNTTCTAMFAYAEINKRSNRKFINDYCTTSADCSEPNNRCAMNTCQCKPGYSYKHSNESCITSCDLYGSTFTIDPGFCISQHNDEIMAGVTAEQCMQACVDETRFECRSIEWMSVHQSCVVSSATAFTASDDYMSCPINSYFQRNCQ